MNTTENCKQLMYAVLYQAVKDYFSATAEEQEIILKELRLFGNKGAMVAEQLLLHPDEIKARLNHDEL